MVGTAGAHHNARERQAAICPLITLAIPCFVSPFRQLLLVLLAGGSVTMSYVSAGSH